MGEVPGKLSSKKNITKAQQEMAQSFGKKNARGDCPQSKLEIKYFSSPEI